jgi:hypothetical protein
MILTCPNCGEILNATDLLTRCKCKFTIVKPDAHPEQQHNDEQEEAPIHHRHKPKQEPKVKEWKDIP